MHSNNSNSTLSSSCWKVFLIYVRCMIYLSCLKLNCYNLYMYISPKEEGLTYFFKVFIHSVTFILIIFLIYRRKFCNGHILLVLAVLPSSLIVSDTILRSVSFLFVLFFICYCFQHHLWEKITKK